MEHVDAISISNHVYFNRDNELNLIGTGHKAFYNINTGKIILPRINNIRDISEMLKIAQIESINIENMNLRNVKMGGEAFRFSRIANLNLSN